MSGDRRSASYAPGDVLRTSSLILPPRRVRQATTALHLAVILPPPVVEDDGDLPTLASQLDHEPDGAL